MFQWNDGPLGRDPAWMPGWPLWAWFTLAAALGLLGVWLLARAALRRFDAGACCARCGYNLEGLTPGGRCPECGRAAAQRAGWSDLARRWRARSWAARWGLGLAALSGVAGAAPAVERHGLFVLVPDRALAEVVLRTPADESFNWKAAAHGEFARRAETGCVRPGLIRSMIVRSKVLAPIEMDLRLWDVSGGSREIVRPGYWLSLPEMCGKLSVEMEFEPGVLRELHSMAILVDDAEGGVDPLRMSPGQSFVACRIWSHGGWSCYTGVPGPYVFVSPLPERVRVRARIWRSGAPLDLGWVTVQLRANDNARSGDGAGGPLVAAWDGPLP